MTGGRLQPKERDHDPSIIRGEGSIEYDKNRIFEVDFAFKMKKPESRKTLRLICDAIGPRKKLFVNQ